MMPAIDQVPEHVSSGRGAAQRRDLAEADVVEDDKLVAGPAAQAGLVGAWTRVSWLCRPFRREKTWRPHFEPPRR